VVALAVGAAGRGAAQPVVVPSDQQSQARSGDQEVKPGTSEVRVSEYMTVDIIAQNDSIINVLQKLAIQARRNIVPSHRVDGLVNATIRGVPFYEALEGLLQPNGLGFVERGEFIYVYTAQELSVLQLGADQPVTRLIHLDYITAVEAMQLAKPLLSEKGSIEGTKDRRAAESEGGAEETLRQAFNLGAGDQDEVYTPDKDEFPLANAVVVHDFPENVKAIENFLRELDTRPEQVLIEVTILQTSLTEQNAFGVDFAMLSGVDFTNFFNFPSAGVPLDIQTSVSTSGTNDEFTTRTAPILLPNSGYLISNPGNTGQGPATFRGGILYNDVGVFIRALDTVSDVTLLSNPKILALNRQRARVHIGARVGYMETAVVENQVLESIKFIDTGIELDIRPYILRDGRIRLELAPKLSAVTFRTLTSAFGGETQIPDEQIQTVSTDVLVPAGYTAVLGGLFREDTTKSRSQVPVLGDIPVLGVAFRGYDDKVEKSEIVFLVKPTALKDSILKEQGERAEAYEDRVRVGTRLGLLPWSRERRAWTLNLKAERYAKEGKIDKALYALRRSLELNPNQPDVIRMREALTGNRTEWAMPSMLDRIIGEEYDQQPSGERDETGAAEPAPPEQPSE
jgi:type IV pilus assembly protein PilQ